ncbi:apoptosis regulator BAX-like [Antennarius striatus]|uniref:apoptosis regulator BAX-like n=1 Tax=Antennarius striatus TaxID=241820 RepID=UPI0035B1C599
MAAEGNGSGMSDQRIGEALIREVIQEELRGSHSQNIPPLTPVQVTTMQERNMVDQLTKMVRIIGDRVKDDQELQDIIDGVAACPNSVTDRFREVANNVLQEGISWEYISVLFYVAGKLAVKVVEAFLPNLVKDLLKCAVEFFRNNLLNWVREHGGWINSFSELAVASMQRVTRMNSHSCGLVLTFIAGLAIGGFISWRMTK